MELQTTIPSNITVLLIEDDEVDVMGVRRAFRQNELKYPLVVFPNGLEALAKLRSGKIKSPYVVLLDLNTPKMNGIEFLHEARSDPDLQKTIIFVLTTSKDEDDKDKAYKHNVAGYIVKGDASGGFGNVADLVEQYARSVEFP